MVPFVSNHGHLDTPTPCESPSNRGQVAAPFHCKPAPEQLAQGVPRSALLDLRKAGTLFGGERAYSRSKSRCKPWPELKKDYGQSSVTKAV